MSIPSGLRRALDEGRLIPFAGAGVSRSIQKQDGTPLLPSWPELLNAAADQIERDGKQNNAVLVRAQTEEGRYLRAAEDAQKGLGGEWASFLKDQIEIDRADIDLSTLALPKALWALSPVLVTTNYDRVLRIAHPDPADINEWTIEAPAEQSALLRGRLIQHTLWYLHGRIGDAAGVILTPDGFTRLYGSEKAKEDYTAAKHTLESLLGSHTFLFVGFSFADEAIGATLESFADGMKDEGGTHYAILPPGEADRVRALDLPVEVLEAEHGAPTLALLHEMAEVAQAATPADTSPSPGATVPSGAVADFSPRHPAFYIPFPQKGDQVVGRADALEKVRSQLESGTRTSIGQAAAFTGLGGLGKTQLAVEYAYAHREDYLSGVVWITADQEIEPQLIEAAEKARWVSPLSDRSAKLDIARHRVRTFDGGLVVFDNVDDRAAIEPYLPAPDSEPHLLLTSRSTVAGFTPIPLGTLDSEDTYTMLVQEAGRAPDGWEEEKAAREIVARLDGLPLAVELAGAYLRYRSAATYAGYLELFEEGAMRALARGGLSSFTRHDADVASALAVQDRLIEEVPALPAVLDVLTWSASAAMSQSLLQVLLHEVSPGDLREALDLGESLRLLRRVPETDRFAIHRLVAEVRREKGTPDADWATATARRLADWFKERRTKFDQLEAYEADLDHLVEWAARVEPHQEALAAELVWLQAYPPYHRGQPDLILSLLNAARALFDESGAKDPAFNAHLLHDLSTALSMKGRFAEALAPAESSLSIRRATLGDGHSDTAHSLDGVGATLADLGRHEEALEMAEASLATRRATLGDGHPDTARSLGNLGVTLADLGRYKEALEMAEAALATRRAALGDDHPDTAHSLGSVGATLHDLGRYEEALEKKEAALATRRAALGDDHPDTAHSLDSVGATLHDLGRYEEALEKKEAALATRRAALGDDHPDTARSLGSVGTTLGNLGRYEEAQKHLEIAIALLEESMGDAHSLTLYFAKNLAAAYAKRGQAPRGLQLVTSRLKLADKSLPVYAQLRDLRNQLSRQVPGARRRKRRK